MNDYEQAITTADSKITNTLDDLHKVQPSRSDTEWHLKLEITKAVCRAFYWGCRVIAAAIAKPRA